MYLVYDVLNTSIIKPGDEAVKMDFTPSDRISTFIWKTMHIQN